MTAVNDVIVRSIPAPEPTSPGKKSKPRALARVGAGLAVLAVSATTLLTGFAVTPTGTAPGTVAMAEESDGLIDSFFGGIVDTFNPCQNPDMDDLPGIREYDGDTTRFGTSPQNYTAYEWYGSAATNSWENYTWDEVGGGCYLTLQGFNVIPNLMLSLQNNIATGVVIPSISWVSGVNLIDLFFLNPDSVVQQMVQGLNDVFYAEYLIVILVLSSASIIWVGLVKRRYRDSVQDLVWIIAATAVGAFFLSNPTLIAGWMDKGVYAVQSTVISAATQAGTFQDSSTRCTVDVVDPEYPVSPQVRTMQCSLWDAFVLQPWAQGQMGKAATEGITVDGANATYKDANSAAMVLLDVRTYNREEVSSGATTSDAKAGIDERKEQQWAALGETIVSNPAAQVGHPYWTGEAWIERMTIAAGQFAAKLFAFVPLVMLSFGMLGQQIVFVLLMLVAPFFLLAGIFPAARRFALGWLEMVLATGLKRIIYAALIGLLFLWFAAVSSVQIPTGTLSVIVGINAQVLLMAIGAVVILMIQRKVIKKAGDAINLGGQRITDGGKTREFLTMTGGAVQAGLGSKVAGGSFSEGFGNNFDNPAAKNPAVRRFNAERRRDTVAADRAQKGQTSSSLENVDLTSEQAAPAGTSTNTPRPSSTRRPGKKPAGTTAGTTNAGTASAASTSTEASAVETPAPRGTNARPAAGAASSRTSGTSGTAPRPARRGNAATAGPTSVASALDSDLADSTGEQSPSRPRAASQLRDSSARNQSSAPDMTSEPAPAPEQAAETTGEVAESEAAPSTPTRPTSTTDAPVAAEVEFSLAAKDSPEASTGEQPTKPSPRPARPAKRDK